MKPTGTQIKKMAELLNDDFDSAEDAAAAAIKLSWEMFEERGKFTVAAQLKRRGGGSTIPPEDDRAMKITLGLYPTITEARKAGHSLAYAMSTHDEWRWWALPVYHQTPASFHSMLKREREAEVASDNDGWKNVIKSEITRLKKLGDYIPTTWEQQLLEETQ